MQTTTITTRSRNLGYAYTTDPRDFTPRFRFAAPDTIGTTKTIRAAMIERRRNIGDGTYYKDALFVAGIQVLSTADGGPSIREVLSEIELTGSAVVPLDAPLSASEAASILGVTRRTIVNYHADGRFPGAWKTPGGHLRIPESEVRALRGEV